jgi:hypothetical protein
MLASKETTQETSLPEIPNEAPVMPSNDEDDFDTALYHQNNQ